MKKNNSPEGIAVQVERTSSTEPTLEVTWSEPIFVGPDLKNLPYVCNRKNGSKFSAGTTAVTCFANGHSTPACTFAINVTGEIVNCNIIMPFLICKSVKDLYLCPRFDKICCSH